MNTARILIVEDDITSQPIWDYIMQRVSPKIRYDWATSEPEAEDLIESASEHGHPYDLIISDIFLSGSKTGLDLWLKYHQRFSGHMMLISSIEYPKMLKYLRGQADAPVYMRKPIVPHDCIAAVYEILHERDASRT